jgi:nucleotide-binding universal stress UspA family protein
MPSLAQVALLHRWINGAGKGREAVSATLFLSLWIVTFACIGLVLGIVMGRLGHSPWAWGMLGLVLGPIALILALLTASSEQPRSRLLAPGVSAGGPVDVLVGIDGSPQSATATTTALQLLGDRIGRLTLAAVTTETATSVAGRQEQARLQDELERQVAGVHAWLRDRQLPVPVNERGEAATPRLVLRSGQPAVELERIAAEDGYGLLVVGAKGSGLSRALLGSVATRLAAGSSVPVLIVSDRTAPDRDGRTLAG